MDLRDQPGVQDRGQRPPGRVEVAGQLVGAGHRQAGRLAHQVAHPELVGRVAHAEVARHGEGLDGVGVACDRGAGGGLVEGRLLVAQGAVAAGDEGQGIAADGGRQGGALEGLLVVADQQQADRVALALDHRVGRQGGGEGDQPHVLGRPPVEDAFHDLADAERQVVLGGQRLGRGHDARGLVVENGVAIGAAGIDSQKHGRVLMPPLPICGAK